MVDLLIPRMVMKQRKYHNICAKARHVEHMMVIFDKWAELGLTKLLKIRTSQKSLPSNQ